MREINPARSRGARQVDQVLEQDRPAAAGAAPGVPGALDALAAALEQHRDEPLALAAAVLALAARGLQQAGMLEHLQAQHTDLAGRAADLERIMSISADLAAGADLGQVLEHIVRAAAFSMGEAPCNSILLLEPDGITLRH